MMLLSSVLGLVLGGCSFSGAQHSGNPEQASGNVVLTEATIPGSDPGIQLYVRNKHLDTKQTYQSQDVILFLEPFSVPTTEGFDVPGYSWMEDYAKKGYDTWAMDFRGFGRSTRPTANPSTADKSEVRATECEKDLQAVVEYIKKTRDVSKINLVGWSYGAVIAGMYAADHPENVEKLVLYGFMHGFNLPMITKPFDTKDKPGQFNPDVPEYQVVDFDTAMHHWHMMMDGMNLVTPDAMEAVRNVFNSSDSTSSTRQNHAIRRAMGPMVDLYEIWNNRPLYDLSKIHAPVLVIHGDKDFFAEKGILDKLTGTQDKKEVVIKDATHWVLYEKHRDQLLSAVDQFLRGH